MSGPSVAVRGLSKKFCPDFRRSLLYGAFDMAGELALGPRRRGLRRGEFWALDDVSFEVCAGEALAVIGHNGAGKSTLLKLLHGLMRPDLGSLRTQGRVVALIELGIGMNPLLTGRENIRIAVGLHGITGAEAEALIPSVLDFAELQDAADMVVQSYSTGMRARLAYGVAVQLRPQVMLVDEVLAVGDLAFQRKCLRHMQTFLRGGGTLLLVSHALSHIQAICTRAILLDRGRIVAEGEPGAVIERYYALRPPEPPPAASEADAVIQIDDLRVTDADGGQPRSGSPARLTFSCRAGATIDIYHGVGVWSEDGWICITTAIERTVHRLAGETRFHCFIETLPLVPGRYRVRPLVYDSVAHAPIVTGGRYGHGDTIEITGDTDKFAHGQRQMGQLIILNSRWSVDQPASAS